jgi:hypothetical protein
MQAIETHISKGVSSFITKVDTSPFITKVDASLITNAHVSPSIMKTGVSLIPYIEDER